MTAPTRHVRIELPAHPGGKAVIEVEGADIAEAVRNIDISAGADQPTEVFIGLAATPVTIDGQAHVWIPARVVDLLADHGWYPPAHAIVGGSGVTLNKPPTDGGEPA